MEERYFIKITDEEERTPFDMRLFEKWVKSHYPVSSVEVIKLV